MTAIAIMSFIAALANTSVDAATAWQKVSALVKENREPTADEWAWVQSLDDSAHAGLQAATPIQTI